MVGAYVRKYRFLLLAISGALTGLTLVFPSVGILEWIILSPAIAVLLDLCSDTEVSYKKAYLYGFVMLSAYYVVTFHWFCYMYPLEFTGMAKPAALFVVLFAWLGLAAFQAATMAFLVPLAAFVIRRRAVLSAPLLHPFVIAAVWTVFEWLQAHTGFIGVPWARLCLGQADMSVMIQSASLLGSYFISLALLLVNGLVAYIFLYASRKTVAWAVAVSIFAVNVGIGIICLCIPQSSGRTVRAAAIQGNISTSEKWSGDSLERTKSIYRELSLRAAADGAELIVWPETAFPYNIDANLEVRDFICEVARDCNATLVVSTFTDVEGSNKLYNSVWSVDKNGNMGETRYHKINLVPFGEFIPFGDLVTTLIPPLAELGLMNTDLEFGKGAEVMLTDSGKISPLICFDSIYEDNALDSVRAGAELLTVSTNDSWFGNSAAVYMHNAQSKLRAVETGRYVVRAANTGVSSIISQKGEALELLSPLVDGYVISDVNLSSGRTLYSHIGNVLVYICMGFVIATAVCGVGIKTKNETDEG